MVKDNSISARIITAFVIITPILVVLLFAPRWVAIVLLFTISFLAFAEWLSLSNKAKTTKKSIYFIICFYPSCSIDLFSLHLSSSICADDWNHFLDCNFNSVLGFTR